MVGDALKTASTTAAGGVTASVGLMSGHLPWGAALGGLGMLLGAGLISRYLAYLEKMAEVAALVVAAEGKAGKSTPAATSAAPDEGPESVYQITWRKVLRRGRRP